MAFADAGWIALTGVAFTSLSSGLGEPTFLAYSASFNKNVISTWSSGTGGAGIIGAISYTLLRAVGLSNKQTLLVMIAVPCLEALTFFLLLRKPESLNKKIESNEPEKSEDDMESNVEPLGSFKEKIFYIKHLLIYMLPLTLVYLFEYFINQGLVIILNFLLIQLFYTPNNFSLNWSISLTYS